MCIRLKLSKRDFRTLEIRSWECQMIARLSLSSSSWWKTCLWTLTNIENCVLIMYWFQDSVIEFLHKIFKKILTCKIYTQHTISRVRYQLSCLGFNLHYKVQFLVMSFYQIRKIKLDQYQVGKDKKGSLKFSHKINDNAMINLWNKKQTYIWDANN